MGARPSLIQKKNQESAHRSRPREFEDTGKQDAATGLYYYGARYYDSSLGRLITRDPAKYSPGDPQNAHPYSYAKNNPLRFTDPTGACICFYDIAEFAASAILALLGYEFDAPGLTTPRALVGAKYAQLIEDVAVDLGPKTWLSFAGTSGSSQDVFTVLEKAVLPDLIAIAGLGVDYLKSKYGAYFLAYHGRKYHPHRNVPGNSSHCKLRACFYWSFPCL